uniref:Ig-like domain-containing protein n=1 Tax=Amphiprion percula TaxID=161767 RepID=A0A3P8S992_AMPPE
GFVFLKIFFVALCLSLSLTWSLPDVADTEVSCGFMERCILPCSFQVGSDVIITWTHFKTINLLVHSYYDNQDQFGYQDQSYRNRTSLFKDQLSRGTASLQLTGVKVQDEGRYQCFIKTINGEKASFINVKIDVTIPASKITCSSEGIYPQPELTWSTTPPSNINLLNSTTVQQNEQQLYSISSSLILSHSDTDLLYSCTISTPTNRRRAAWRKLSDEDSSHRLGKWTYLQSRRESTSVNSKLLDVRSCFIDGTSGPVLNSLLDKLLEKKVLTDSERESADEVKNRRDKARFVIDTVRKKGDAASSEMMEFFCELDPFLCEHLDLM